MRRILISLLLALTLSTASCSTNVCGGPPRPHVAIWHIVIIHLNNPGDPDAQKKLIEASKTFVQIPGVRSVDVGKVIPGDRPHQDASFDVALVMGFASKEDLAAYVAHPVHVKAVNDVLKPLAKDYTSYDFTNE